ncbi:MAG: glycoside hydrolase family 92 protein, partial [Cyclobacteriaceae bacterium]
MNLRTIITSFLLLVIATLTLNAGPGSIAEKASVTASSSIEGFSESNVIDGEIRIQNIGEWACEGQTTFWGYIRYPWIQLDWEESQTINRVVLYDRPGLDEHTAGGTLIFSDGSEIPVTEISNDGAPKTIRFEPKTVKWVRFRVMDGVGFNLGLSEIEIFPAYGSYLNLVDWVDPFIETTRGRYFYFTPGATPFGMMASAPITRNKNQYGGGYNYNSTEILGFGNLHGWMISGIQVMPTIGSIDPTKGEQNWKSNFSHQDEIAQPGYQRVFLEDYKTWVELTSTKRTTQYRFKYTQKSTANILTNLGGYLGNSTMTGAYIKPVGNTGFEGSFISSGRLWGGPKQVKVFFVIEFDKPFVALDGWNDQNIIPNFKEIQAPIKMTRRDSMDYGVVVQSYWDAPSSGASARFDVNPGDEIQMRISISYTSLENARNNLIQESKSWDFEKYRNENQNAWEDLLGRILIKGGTIDQKIKFYTDLWHVLLGRHIINDFSGDYPDYTQ